MRPLEERYALLPTCSACRRHRSDVIHCLPEVVHHVDWLFFPKPDETIGDLLFIGRPAVSRRGYPLCITHRKSKGREVSFRSGDETTNIIHKEEGGILKRPSLKALPESPEIIDSPRKGSGY